MSEGKENPKESTKPTPKQTEQTDVVRLNESFAGKAGQGEQGISLAPVGSQATDPFASQDVAPTNAPQLHQPAQDAPVDISASQSQQASPSQPTSKSSDD